MNQVNGNQADDQTQNLTSEEQATELEPLVYDLDCGAPEFVSEVLNQPGTESLLRCYACGTCSGGCPVREVTEDYNPRRIINLIHLGMREVVLNSEFIWLCSSCYTCQERCPQGVKITDIIVALRNLASKTGHAHPGHAKQKDLVTTLGRLYEITEFDNKKRQKLGLPPLTTTFPDLATLMASLQESRP